MPKGTRGGVACSCSNQWAPHSPDGPKQLSRAQHPACLYTWDSARYPNKGHSLRIERNALADRPIHACRMQPSATTSMRQDGWRKEGAHGSSGQGGAAPDSAPHPHRIAHRRAARALREGIARSSHNVSRGSPGFASCRFPLLLAKTPAVVRLRRASAWHIGGPLWPIRVVHPPATAKALQHAVQGS